MRLLKPHNYLSVSFFPVLILVFLFSPASLSAETNFVPNPTLETPSPNPAFPQSWLKGGSGTDARILTYPVAVHNSARAAKTEITSYTSGDAKWYFTSAAASSGQQYIFSDYSISNTTSYVTMRYLLQDGTYKYQDVMLNIPSHSSWTQYSNGFTVPTYASAVASMTVFHLIKSVGFLTVDDYSLTVFTPPPP